MRARSGAIVVVGLLAGCAPYTAPPVEIVGDAESVAALAGSWRGTFRNTQTGRSGMIDFHLSAAGDSASGEVVMYTEHPSTPVWADPSTVTGSPSEPPAWRKIRFVRVEDGYVSGAMESMWEPRCRCFVTTKFLGRMQGDRIEGGFTSRSEVAEYESSGSWEVKRVADGAPAAALPAEADVRSFALACGEEHVQVTLSGDRLRMTVAGESFELGPAPAASGARWAAPGDSGTSYWNKGERTTVTVRGRVLPECRTVRVERAHGTEPFWSVETDGVTLRFTTAGGAPVSVAPVIETAVDGGRRFEGASGGHAISLAVLDAPCSDGMSDMTFPRTATVRVDGREFEGCAGDPAELLIGGEWRVAALDGTPVGEEERATLSFTAEGRVSGRAFCNSFAGSCTITGEALRISGVAGTRMACAPPLMERERAFLEFLGGVSSFGVTPDGAILLRTGEGRELLVRRAPAD